MRDLEIWLKNMTIEEEKTFNGISILNFCWLHTFLYHHQPSRPICLFVFFQYPMELSILVVMQICIKMGPINSQLLVYHHSKKKQWKYFYTKKETNCGNSGNNDNEDDNLGVALLQFGGNQNICISISIYICTYMHLYPYVKVSRDLDYLNFFLKNYCWALWKWNSATFGSDGPDPM